MYVYVCEYLYVYIYMYVYLCVWVCVYANKNLVCVKDNELMFISINWFLYYILILYYEDMFIFLFDRDPQVNLVFKEKMGPRDQL